MDEKKERTLRRRAVRLWLQGVSPRAIAARLQRSQRWLHKWCQRYLNRGREWAHSDSRAPHHCFGYDAKTRALVIGLRQRLLHRPVGLIGPAEIQAILRQQRMLRRVPSTSTIRRILHEAGLISTGDLLPEIYFPRPTARRLRPLRNGLDGALPAWRPQRLCLSHAGYASRAPWS